MTIKQLAEEIRKADNVLITTHVSPDPDTIGSGLGLRYMLRSLGKTAYAVCPEPLNEWLCRLFGEQPLLDGEAIAVARFTPGYIISTDVPDKGRLGGCLEKYRPGGEVDLAIDHHTTGVPFAKLSYIDPAAAAAGQIVYELAKELGVKIDRELARLLYTAISDDSGSFKYSLTSPATLRAAAELISTGFDFAAQCRLLYDSKTRLQLEIERMGYNNMAYFCGGRVCVVCIDKKAKKAASLEGVPLENMSFINNLSRSAGGVEVGVTLREAEDAETETYKISLRSNEYADVSALAARFGGGGHARAAGATIQGSVEEVRALLLTEIEKILR